MNQDTLERLYVTGKYPLLLEEINKLTYDSPSTSLNKIEQAICLSYHSRSLIRLGRVDEAEELINRITNYDINESFSISSLLYQTSIINLPFAS